MDDDVGIVHRHARFREEARRGDLPIATELVRPSTNSTLLAYHLKTRCAAARRAPVIVATQIRGR